MVHFTMDFHHPPSRLMDLIQSNSYNVVTEFMINNRTDGYWSSCRQGVLPPRTHFITYQLTTKQE